MSRVPMTPPSSSTGTLNAAQIPSLTSTWVNSCQSGSVRRSRMAAGSRWLNATAHGPWASRSCSSSTLWAVWSEALAHRSCPSWSTSISPAPSARNSCLAPSVTCCRVGARPCCGFRLSRAPMLWASSEGSIDMATPAFLLPALASWPADPGSTRSGCRAGQAVVVASWLPSSGQGLGPEMPPSRWPMRRTWTTSHHCTPAVHPLNPVVPARRIGAPVPRLSPRVAASGRDRCNRARRGGQGGPNPVCLHHLPEAATTASTLGSANEPSGGHLPNRLALSRRARPKHYPRPLDSPCFATEPGFRLVSDGDFAGSVVLAHHEQQLVLGDGYLKPVDARLESWSALQFTDSPVRLNDPWPSQALRCHVVAAKRRFAAATALRRRADLGCHRGVGGSSCPRLLRHSRKGPPVGEVVRLPGGTTTLQDA